MRAAVVGSSLLLSASAQTWLPDLPRLRIDPSLISVSGISSGADFASQFALAYADILLGVGIWAGQPYHCAVTYFPPEPLFTCASQPNNTKGPGCVGVAEDGIAQCDGCPSGFTVGYDHCKTPAEPNGPGWVNVSQLAERVVLYAANGSLASLPAIARLRAYLYRGSRDPVYLDGSVNNTAALFAALGANVAFVADVPSGHCIPTVDPWVPPSTCGSVTIAGLQNCGYDGAGALLRHVYGGGLKPAAGLSPILSQLYAFNQTQYFPQRWPALATTGYAYVPTACMSGTALCSLHVLIHGCGQCALWPGVNVSMALHAGYAPYADANNMVLLFPQSGGYLERNGSAPSAQLGGCCWDGYGQVGADFDLRSGPQMTTVRAIIAAVAGV